MRYLLNFSYNGTYFEGYQRQGNKRTIQKEIEDNLSVIFDKEIIIFASGRTDSGVHAINQYAHFDVETRYNCEDIKYKLNKRLPSDIHIKNVTIVKNDFHARYNAISKSYTYKINLGEHNPFENHLYYDVYMPLDIDKLEEIKNVFLGEHNFKNYTSKIQDGKNFIRKINYITIDYNNDKINILFNGDGFMKYEIRMIVGNMIYYALGRKTKKQITSLLDSSKREITSCCAPSEGLYLTEVFYE